MEKIERKIELGEKARRERDENAMDNILITIQEYINFLNQIEDLLIEKLKLSSGEKKEIWELSNEEKKKIQEQIGFDFAGVEKILEKDLLQLLEKVNIIRLEIPIQKHNSLYDIIQNSILIDMALFKKRVEEYDLNEKTNEYFISFRNKLEESFKKLAYYLERICSDEEILKKELVLRHGYLQEEKFQGYFFKDKKTKEIIYPGGMKKISYLRFFWECERGNIGEENLEAELKKLDDKFVDKEKIRADFRAKKAD